MVYFLFSSKIGQMVDIEEGLKESILTPYKILRKVFKMDM